MNAMNMNSKNIKQSDSDDFVKFLEKTTKSKRTLLFDSSNESENDLQIFLNEEHQVKNVTNIGIVTEENLNQGVAADSLLSNQEKKEGIKRVVSRIQSIDQNKILLVASATDNENKRKNSNISFPYSLLSANLLIDCSSNIPEANKTFIVLLLTVFAFALNILKIPYEICVVADQQFRFILKSFEEQHSIQALQRVLDCALIQRYKTNYPDTFHHAVEHMNCPDKTRTQRAIFLFSDGLDEKYIALIDAWNKQVLTNSSISFGLIATTPQDLDNDNNN